MEVPPIQTPSATAIFQALPEDKVKIVAIHPILPYVLLYDEKKVSLVDYKNSRFLLSINPNLYSDLHGVDHNAGGGSSTHQNSAVGHVKALSFYDQRFIQIVCRQHRPVLRSTSVQPPNWFIILCEHRVLLIDQRLGTKNVHQILQERDLQGHHPTSVIPLSPRLLAIGCSDGSIRVWDWLTRMCVRTLKASGEGGGGGSGSDNTNVSVTHLLNAHPDNGLTVDKFDDSIDSGDDSEALLAATDLRFVSVHSDGSVRLWELISQGNIVHGPEPIRLGHVGDKAGVSASSVSYSAGNDSLVAMAHDGKSVIWNLDMVKQLASGSAKHHQHAKGGYKPFENRYPLIRISSNIGVKSSGAGTGEKAYLAALIHDIRFPVGTSSLVCAATKSGTLELFTTSSFDQASLMPLLSAELKKCMPCLPSNSKSSSASTALKLYTMHETNHPRSNSGSLIACGTNFGLCIVQLGRGRGFSQSSCHTSQHHAYHPLWSSKTWKPLLSLAHVGNDAKLDFDQETSHLPAAASASRRIIRYNMDDHALYFSDLVPYPTLRGGGGGGGGRKEAALSHDDSNHVAIKMKDVAKIDLDTSLYVTSFSSLSAHLLPVYNSIDEDARRRSSENDASNRGRSVSGGTAAAGGGSRARGDSRGGYTVGKSLSLKPCLVPSIDGKYIAVHWPFTSVFQVYYISKNSTQNPSSVAAAAAAPTANIEDIFHGKEELRGRCLSLAWISPPPVIGSGLSSKSKKDKSAGVHMHYDQVTLESSYLCILLEEAEPQPDAASNRNRRRTSSAGLAGMGTGDGGPKLSLRVYAFQPLLKNGGVFSYALPVPAATAGIFGGGSVLFVNLVSPQLGSAHLNSGDASAALHAISGDSGCSCCLFYLEIKPTAVKEEEKEEVASKENGEENVEEAGESVSKKPAEPKPASKVSEPSVALKPLSLQGATLPMAHGVTWNVPLCYHEEHDETLVNTTNNYHSYRNTKNQSSLVAMCCSIGIFIYSMVPNKTYDKQPLLKLEAFTSNLKFFSSDGPVGLSFVGNHSLLVSSCDFGGNLYMLHLLNNANNKSRTSQKKSTSTDLDPLIIHIASNNPNELRSPFNHGYISSVKHYLNDKAERKSSLMLMEHKYGTDSCVSSNHSNSHQSCLLLPELLPLPAGGSGGLLSLVAGQFVIAAPSSSPSSTSQSAAVFSLDLSKPSLLLPLLLAAGSIEMANECFHKLNRSDQQRARVIYDRFGVDVPIM